MKQEATVLDVSLTLSKRLLPAVDERRLKVIVGLPGHPRRFEPHPDIVVPGGGSALTNVI